MADTVKFDESEWELEESPATTTIGPDGVAETTVTGTGGGYNMLFGEYDEDPDQQTEFEEVPDQQVDTLDYLINQAKLGVGDSASLVNALTETVFVDPAKALGWYAGLVEKPPSGSVVDNFFKHLTESMQASAEVTGAEPSMKAPGDIAKYTGAAVRAVTDPATLAFPGALIPKLTAAAVGGVGGEFGGDVGKQIGGETGGVIGSLVGGITGGAVAAKAPVVLAPVKQTLSGFNQKIKQYKDVPTTAAAGYAQRFLDRATQELTPEAFNGMVEDFKRMRYIVGDADIPLFVAMADNPAVRAQVLNLVKTDPNVRQTINNQINTLSKRINEKADAFFGSRYVTTDGNLVDISNVPKKVEAINNQVEKLTQQISPTRTPEAIGTAIQNLVTAKAAAVREQMAPQYAALREETLKKGVTMPAEGTEAVYNFVKQNKILDIFGKGTPLDAKIKAYWAPATAETTAPQPLNVALGGTTQAAQKTSAGFKAVPFAEVDSLKKEINRLQRGKLTLDEARKLNQLEGILNESRQTIPANYNQRLIDLDREYYTRVGIPFGGQGIKDIDAKAYAEQVAPIIAGKPTAMRQFLGAVGADGHSTARDAILSYAHKHFVKEGVLNAPALRKYIKDNKSTISQVPGLEEELVKASTDVSRLQFKKTALNTQAREAEKVIANNFLTNTGMGVNYAEVTSRALNDPRYMDKVLVDVKAASPAMSKAVVNSIRRETLELAMNSPEGVVNYLTNPRRAQQVDALFGSQYRGLILDMAKMSDALQRADPKHITDALVKGDLEKKLGGIPLSGVYSVARDRWISINQKIAILGSRALKVNMEESNKKAIIDLLTDPKGLENLAGKKKTFTDITNPLNVRAMYSQFVDLLPTVLYTTAKQELYHQEQE